MSRMTVVALAAGVVLFSGYGVAPAASVSVGVVAAAPVMVQMAPPPLPEYVQPVAPGPGYLWTPGYWDWGGAGYYWVPGTWVMPPTVGLLWTPGWWGFVDGGYRWNPGYWAPQVGFYGGINYGYGYFGVGFSGGEWRGHDFYYNRAVSNVNVTNVRNVYVNRTVIVNHTTVNRVSYNGGRGGLDVRPTVQQRAVERERHVAPTEVQVSHREQALRAPNQRFDAGRQPAVFATPHAERPAGREAQALPGNARGPAPDSRRVEAPRPTVPHAAPQRPARPEFNREGPTHEQIESARAAMHADRAGRPDRGPGNFDARRAAPNAEAHGSQERRGPQHRGDERR